MSGGNWKEMFSGVEKGDKNLVEYHLKTGIDPNYQHPEFLCAALVESIRYNHLEITKLLLEYGADPHIKEVWGEATPLSVARNTKNKKAIDLLNEYINKIDKKPD